VGQQEEARWLATVEVRTEEETEHGWRYHVFVNRAAARDGGGGSNGEVEHIVLLSWVDHEHWSGGRHPPSRVVERLVQLLVEREAEAAAGAQGGRPLPPTFDAATARRWYPGLDKALMESL
jgi:hypothetical protein